MDPAQVIELKAKRDHKPMEELIARGDSPIQQFYKGTTVFITGGSGFLGKQLIEKLLRSCAIKKMYLLMRSRQGQTIVQKLQRLLEETVFDRLRELQPQFANKIVAVEGDIADIRLGLSDTNWTELTKEVNILFHVAATVRFDEHLQKAILTNVRGTREALTFAKQCSEFKKFVHVSTASSHATRDHMNGYIEEKFYPCPVSPGILIELAEELDSSRMNNITKGILNGWWNTYAFTKAVSEELIRTSVADLPICMVKPAIVISSHFEPNPGWLDENSIRGPSGLILLCGLGVLRVFLADSDKFLPMAPVDYVNNATIAAAWDSTEREKNGQKEICVYNIAKNVRFGSIGEYMTKNFKSLSTPKKIWYVSIIATKSKFLYFILSWFYHFIPAYCVDFVFKIRGKELPMGMVSAVDIYKKIDKRAAIYSLYLLNTFNFKDNNFKAMFGRMNDADKFIFNCDLSNMDIEEFIILWAIGLRRYIIKDGLEGSVGAYRKQIITQLVHYILTVIFLYVVWLIFSTVFIFVKNALFYLS